MGDAGPSLPPNYVSLLHLKQRWLQQQQQQQSPKSTSPPPPPPPHQLQSDDSQTSVVKPQNEDSASIIPNEVGTSRNQVKPDAANEQGVNQLKPDDSADSKTTNEAVPPRRRNHRRLKPEVTIQHDSTASKTAAVQVAEDNQEHSTGQSNTRPSTKRRSRNPRFVRDRNQTGGSTSLPEPEPESVQEKKQIDNHPVVKNDTDQSNSKPATKNKSSRGRNPRFVADQNQTESVEEEKKQVDNHPVVEKQEHSTHQSGSKVSKTKTSYRIRNPRVVTDQIPTVGSTAQSEPESVEQGHGADRSNSKPSTKKNGSRSRHPRVVTDQIATGDSTPEPKPEPEAVKEKKHSRYIDGRLNRNEEVWEEKAVAEDVEDLKEGNDSGDGVVAAAAVVKEMNVSHGTNRVWRGSGRFRGGPRNGPPKPPHFRVKGQRTTTTGVWVRKGESAPS